MTNKQRIFIEEYLKCWNGSEAARRAGYKNPNVAASRLIAKDNISAIIEERIEEKCMDADEILVRLAEQARGVPSEYVDDFGFVNFKLLKKTGLLHLIKKIKRNQQGIEVEFYDQQRAMELIGKHLKMWVERHEITGKDGDPIVIVRWDDENEL